VIISKDNPWYTAVDNVIFSKDMTELIHYPNDKEDKEYTIPQGVKIIRKNAIRSTVYLNKLTIPDSVTTIETDGILYTHNLKEIYGKAGSEAENYVKTYGGSIAPNLRFNEI
jgi:hypothetical protein